MLEPKPIVIGQSIIAMLIIIIFLSASLSPQKFLKLVTLRADSKVLEHTSFDASNAVDPRAVISAIPYERGRFVDVLPARRYERSILGGKGDCSNLSQGFAYWLVQRNIGFAIVHLLRIPGFTDGKGHVALETSLLVENENHKGILDILEGGVLTDGQAIVSARDLINRSHGDISVISYHRTRDDRSAYYQAENLDKTVIGFSPDEEVADYFDFVSALYINLGNRSVERYLYDGLALLTGNFPSIRVDERGYDRIMKHYAVARSCSHLVLWLLRLSAVLCALFTVSVVARYLINPRWRNAG